MTSATRDAPGAIRQAQTIDLSSQHLDELGALLTRIAGALQADVTIPAATIEPVALSALRERLAGSPVASSDAAGEFDFF